MSCTPPVSNCPELRRIFGGLLSWCLLPGAVVVLCMLLPGCSQERASEASRSDLRPVREYARVLLDPDEDMRREAFRGLARHGPDAAPAIPALIEALEHDDPKVRRSAAQVLGRIGATAVEPLAVVLENETGRRLLAGAAEALGEIGPPAAPALGIIIDVSGDPWPEVREACALALGKICQGRGVSQGPTTVRIRDQEMADLTRMVLGTENRSSRLGGLVAEVERQNPEPGETRQILHFLGVNTRDMALEMPDEEPPEVIIRLGWDAGKTGHIEAAVETLVGLLEDAEVSVRVAAIQGLGLIGPPAAGAAEALARRAGPYEDPRARREAARALGEIRASSPAIIRILEQCEQSGDPQLRLLAAGVLARLAKEE